MLYNFNLRKAFILNAAILFSTLAFAQVNTNSLWSAWNNNTLHDSIRFKSIQIIITKKYLLSHPDSALLASKMMLDEALQKKQIKFQALARQLLGQSYDMKSNFPEAFKCFDEAQRLYRQTGDESGLADLNLRYANSYAKLGNNSKAFDYYNRNLHYHEKINDKAGLAGDIYGIGRIYFYKGDFTNSIKYQKQAIMLYMDLHDPDGHSKALNAIGLSFFELGNLDSAIVYINKSLKINESTGNKQLLSYNLNNLGRVYLGLSEYDKSIEYFKRSLQIKMGIGDKWAASETMLRLGQAFQLKGNNREAIDWCTKSLHLANEINENRWRIETYKCLYKANKKLNNLIQALVYNDLYLSLEDSLQKDKTVKKLQEMEFEKQALSDSLKQEQEKLKIKIAHDAEVRKKNQQRNILIGIGCFMLIIALAMWNRLQFVRKSRAEISKERDRSDNLLLNILPAEVAEELKAKGSADAKQFAEVTVMFTDFKGFTEISEKLTPSELVSEIDTCFKAFDNIISRYHIEKIKTIGDAYMCAGGLPIANTTNAIDVVNSAIDIQQFMQKHSQQRANENKYSFEIRIGVHTGPVVAGIVGVNKFAYDIWGDTVNIASRMESSGEAGKVNISSTTYELVKNKFKCRYRGKIQAKNKGEIDMYFVESIS